jgi:hypothetical protein
MLVKDEMNYKWNTIEEYPLNLFYAERDWQFEGEKAPTRLCKLQSYRLIRASSDKGDLVVEPFAGSGVVPFCCYNLDRKCIGFELNENMRGIIDSNFTFDVVSLLEGDKCPECGAELISTREGYGKVRYRCSECRWSEKND